MSARTPLIALLLALGLAACSSLEPEDEIRLANFKQNSKRFYEDGDFRRAEDQCRKGLLLDPDDQSLRWVLGFALVRQDRPTAATEAVSVFEACIDDESDFEYRSRLGLGEAHLKLAYFRALQQERIEADEKLTQEERETQLAMSRQQRDRSFMAAEAALREVLDSPRKDDVDAQNAMARLLSTQGRYEEAAEVMRTLAASLESSIHLRESQVSTETLSAESKAVFEKTLKRLKEQRTNTLGLLATVVSKLSRWEETVSVYAQIESDGAMRPADYFSRGVAYEQLGARDAALADFDLFLRKAAARNIPYADIGSKVSDAMDHIVRLRSPVALQPASQPAPVEEPAVVAWPATSNDGASPFAEPVTWPEPTAGDEP